MSTLDRKIKLYISGKGRFIYGKDGSQNASLAFTGGFILCGSTHDDKSAKHLQVRFCQHDPFSESEGKYLLKEFFSRPTTPTNLMDLAQQIEDAYQVYLMEHPEPASD